MIWQRLAQARAFLAGRDYVTPDDVQDVAEPVLAVRLGIEPDATARVHTEITASVPVPVYNRRRLRVRRLTAAALTIEGGIA